MVMDVIKDLQGNTQFLDIGNRFKLVNVNFLVQRSFVIFPNRIHDKKRSVNK